MAAMLQEGILPCLPAACQSLIRRTSREAARIQGRTCSGGRAGWAGRTTAGRGGREGRHVFHACDEVPAVAYQLVILRRVQITDPHADGGTRGTLAVA